MKRKFIFSITLLIIALRLSAQISITQADLPAASDTLRYSVSLPQQTFDFSLTGENYHWDFSSIQFQTQGLEEYYTVSSVNFLMGFIFPGSIARKMSGFLPIDDLDLPVEDFYIVYNKNSARYIQEGFFFIVSGLPLHLKYTSNDFVYRLPLQFQDYDSTAFAGNRSLGDTLSLTRSGYRINEVDGWGNITTPYGEFECIRVKTILYEYDSLFVASLPSPLVLERTTLEYKWLAKDEKIPVMEASFLLMDNGGQVPIGVRYRDIYREPEDIQAPVASFHADKTNVTVGDTISFFNTSTPEHDLNSYQWIFDPASVTYLMETGPMSIEPVLAFPEAGEFSVTLIAENSAGKDSLVRQNYIMVEPEVPSDITDHSQFLKQLLIYTTGDGNRLYIKNLSFAGNLQIFDTSGRMLINRNLAALTEHSVDVSSLPGGSYIVKIIAKTGANPPVSAKILIP